MKIRSVNPVHSFEGQALKYEITQKVGIRRESAHQQMLLETVISKDCQIVLRKLPDRTFQGFVTFSDPSVKDLSGALVANLDPGTRLQVKIIEAAPVVDERNYEAWKVIGAKEEEFFDEDEIDDYWRASVIYDPSGQEGWADLVLALTAPLSQQYIPSLADLPTVDFRRPEFVHTCRLEAKFSTSTSLRQFHAISDLLQTKECRHLAELVMGERVPTDRAPPYSAIHHHQQTRELTMSLADTLNSSQRAAYGAMLSRDPGFTLVSGPPGTGKTKTISCAVIAHAGCGNKTLLCAPSNYASDNLVNAILRADLSECRKRFGLHDHEIVRVYPDGVEHSTLWAGKHSSDLVGGEGRQVDDGGEREGEEEEEEEELDELALTSAIEMLNSQLERQPHSLSSRIQAHADRIAQSLTEDDLRRREAKKWIRILLSIRKGERFISPAQARAFTKQTTRYQQEVLRQAKVVVTTLTNSGTKSLKRNFDYRVVVIDEAGQASEPESLAPVVRNFERRISQILVGDVMQLKPTVISAGHNEFAGQLGTSLFARLLDRGHHVNHLKTQYRMVPEISLLPNYYTYDAGLEDAPQTDIRSAGRQVALSVFEHYRANWVLVNANNGESMKPRVGHSKINPVNVVVLHKLIKQLARLRYVEARHITVLVPYKAQRWLSTDSLKKLVEEPDVQRMVADNETD